MHHALIANVRHQGLQLPLGRFFKKGFQLGEGGAQQIANFPYNSSSVRGRSMLTQSKRTLILNISSCVVLRNVLKQN